MLRITLKTSWVGSFVGLQLRRALVGVDNLSAKRSKRKACQFEMLFTKRNTDDGYGKQNSKNEVRKTYPDATNQNPNDIHGKRKAT
jgi:hypothetical protein